MISDPPYGISHVKGASGTNTGYAGRKAVSRNVEAIEGDDRPFDPSPWLGYPAVLLWGADHFSQRLPHGRWLAWNKLGDKEPWDSFSDVEFAWNNRRGAARIFGYVWKGMCQGAGEDKGSTRDHPTQKPVALMRWCLEQAEVAIDALVLDPYAGAGSTAVACYRSGRRSVSVELNRHFADVAVRRMERELAQPLLPFSTPEPAKQTELFNEP